jgi:hypothetical protein
MTGSRLLQAGWVNIKEYAAEVMAGFLIYGGISQIISALKYRIASAVLLLINAVIRKDFPDQFLLTGYGPLPWRFEASYFAMAVIFIVGGILLGFRVNARGQRQPAPVSPVK